MARGAAASAQTLTAKLPAGVKMSAGLTFEAIGLVVLVAGVRTESLAAFLIGGVLAGTGAGVIFKAGIGTVVAMAAPAKRGEALAGLFLVGYFGLILPALGIGVAVRSFDTATVITGFAAVLLAILAGVGVLNRR